MPLDTSPPNPNQWFGRLAQVVTGGVQNQSLTSYDGVGNPTAITYSDHTAESFGASYNEWDQFMAYGSLEGYGYLAGSPAYDIGTLQTKGGAGYTYPAPGQPRPHAPTSVSGVGASATTPTAIAAAARRASMAMPSRTIWRD